MLPGILVDDIDARTQGMAMLKLEDFVISSYDARGPSICKSDGNLEIFCDYNLKNRVARKYLWEKFMRIVDSNWKILRLAATTQGASFSY